MRKRVNVIVFVGRVPLLSPINFVTNLHSLGFGFVFVQLGSCCSCQGIIISTIGDQMISILLVPLVPSGGLPIPLKKLTVVTF